MLKHPAGSIPGLGNSRSVAVMVWAEGQVIQRCAKPPLSTGRKASIALLLAQLSQSFLTSGFLMHSLSPSVSGLNK